MLVDEAGASVPQRLCVQLLAVTIDVEGQVARVVAQSAPADHHPAVGHGHGHHAAVQPLHLQLPVVVGWLGLGGAHIQQCYGYDSKTFSHCQFRFYDCQIITCARLVHQIGERLLQPVGLVEGIFVRLHLVALQLLMHQLVVLPVVAGFKASYGGVNAIA